MQDIAFRKQELNPWMELFPHARVERFENAGHFVQDEKGEEICQLVEEFMINERDLYQYV